STGSILGQVICRDAFHGKERGILFSNIGVALSISPAIGPFIGGAIAQFVGWRGVFMALILFGMIVWMQTRTSLPETHPKHSRSKGSILNVTKTLIKDPKVLVYGGIIGGLNGIVFSYYGEGSFFLIEMLGMSPFVYGISFILLAVSAAIGCHISKYHVSRDVTLERLVMMGLGLCTSAMLIFTLCALSNIIHGNRPLTSISITLACMSLFFAGMDIAKPSLLSKALDSYQHVIGTASSLFGFYYYLIIALITFIMATVRDGTLRAMPIFFLCLSGMMIVIFKLFITKQC
ncbi:MAG: MFS transporter, partial [Alphaproteobacteria bacterium]|nr:MFS transporter [Alphaproteobacteria bacterium]